MRGYWYNEYDRILVDLVGRYGAEWLRTAICQLLFPSVVETLRALPNPQQHDILRSVYQNIDNYRARDNYLSSSQGPAQELLRCVGLPEPPEAD